MSSEEATVLENRSCDIGCYKNAYERYQFDEQENKGAVDNLMTLLNGVKPNIVPSGTNPKRICDLRNQIRAVQDELPAFAQWKNTDGKVTQEFVVELNKQLQRPSRLDQ